MPSDSFAQSPHPDPNSDAGEAECPMPPGGRGGHYGTNGTFEGEENEEEKEQESDETDEADEAEDNDDDEFRLNLSDIQLRAIELATHGLSDVQIAKTLSISRKTLWRWKTFDLDYRRTLDETRVQVHATASDRYHVLLSRATAVLARCLEDAEDQNRFHAARIVLAMASSFKPAAAHKPSSFDELPLPDIPPDMG